VEYLIHIFLSYINKSAFKRTVTEFARLKFQFDFVRQSSSFVSVINGPSRRLFNGSRGCYFVCFSCQTFNTIPRLRCRRVTTSLIKRKTCIHALSGIDACGSRPLCHVVINYIAELHSGGSRFDCGADTAIPEVLLDFLSPGKSQDRSTFNLAAAAFYRILSNSLPTIGQSRLSCWQHPRVSYK
jgi:hypothetical protein